MTPIPQEHLNKQSTLEDTTQDHDVVISGVAGLYPNARYIRDLENILYNKVNPITHGNLRYQYNHPEMAQYSGNVPDLDKFDAQFFMVHYNLGNVMDPMARKVLEQTYEAIYDAGVNPQELNGKKVGVYIGICTSESEKAMCYTNILKSGFGMAGCSKTMFANRISYWLNTKGPSMSIDQGCCSSTVALEQAYQAISRGELEAAIVGGTKICLHPQTSVLYSRVIKMSKDGKTKSFDQNAEGCVKSEAINVLFLQKAKDALRVYAKLLHVKSEFTRILDDETGPRYGFFRDPDDTAKFLNDFYKEAKISPNVVEYVEAFGSGEPEADKSELEALDKVFGGSRDKPLLVGSVMSNIGYGEAASGISAITKVLLGYQRGELAGNLHYDTQRNDVAALRDGRLKILSDNHKFRGSFTAVNNMSITGVNAHILMHFNHKPKNINKYKTRIPRLVTISSRQESGVKYAIDQLRSHPIEPEEIALLHNIHKTRTPGHLGRGYVILDTNNENQTICLSENVNYYNDGRRPLWFLYSGMGSQWTGMGAALMKIPIFAESIQNSHRILEPKGINLVELITSSDPTTFDNILNSFVSIASIQIALTDILSKLGIFPDNIIGHSVGELGCAYADGCLTAEETILCAYYRGLVSQDTKFIRGSMAAVGLGFKEISKLCPPEIVIACHNSDESSTISGPEDVVKEFVAQLTAKSIFAKEVACSNIPYHSRYIAEAGPVFQNYLKTVIKNPKMRSQCWLSTSVPEEKWSEPLAKYSSAEYHTNNLLNPVLFEETSKHIPSNAVVVEVAPHGLLQAIVKRSLAESCTNIPLTRRGHSDNAVMVLEAIGKLYMEGFNPKLQELYPKVEFPVSTGTPYLSNLVQWVHEETWPISVYASANRKMAASCEFVVSIHDDEYSYLKGHIIRKRILLPFSFVLVAVWDTLAMILELRKKSFNVKFQDIHLYAQPVLHDQRQIKLDVSLHRGNGQFEVMENDSRVATGYISYIKNVVKNYNKESDTADFHSLSSRDVYQLLYERDYGYCGKFQSILSVNDTITEAKLVWQDNWVTLIDGIMQLNVLKHSHNTVSRPSLINSLTIDVIKHNSIKESGDNQNTVNAYISDVFDQTWCGGVVMKKIRFHNVLPMVEDQIRLKALQFVPRYQTNCEVLTSIQLFLQIVAENVNKDKITIIDIKKNSKENCVVSDALTNICKENKIPGINIEYQLVDRDTIAQQHDDNRKSEISIVLVRNLSNDDELCNILHRILPARTFIINKEDICDCTTRVRPGSLYEVVAVCKDKRLNLNLELVRWRPTKLVAATTSTVRSQSDLPFLKTVRGSLPSQTALIIISSYPPVIGLKDLVKEWRQDVKQNDIYVIMANEKSQQQIHLEGFPNVDLAFNVLRNGVWGGEYFMPIKEDRKIMTDVMLQNEQIGNFEYLNWVPAPKSTKSGTAVTVHYAGIHMEDVRKAAGMISSHNEDNFDGYGMEFSGITERGEKVMGLIKEGSARSKLVADPDLIWPVPSHWSLEDAATVPLAYVYAFYCLDIKVRRLTEVETQFSVLVHGGTGALGQAAIRVALAYGYKVFATVSDVKKKTFLLSLFPDLKEDHIGNSRDVSFADMVRAATNGNGVDVVFSCVKGELKNFSLNCSGPYGITFDTDQTVNEDVFLFGMNFLTSARNYVAVNISSIFSDSENLTKIRALLSDGISRGFVRPLTRVTYEASEAPRAFRLLATSKHRGRVLLRLAQGTPLVHNRIICAPEHNHLILCSTESLGLQIVDKLITRGARTLHIHLLQVTGQLYYKLREWTNLGVKVNIYSEELKDEEAVYKLVGEVLKSGFLVGVYVAYANTTCSFIDSLDASTRKLCPQLKYFLVPSCNGTNRNAEYTCLMRNKGGHSATYFYLTSLQNDEVNYKNILDSIEQALCASQTIVLAQTKSSPKTSLHQQIANLVGITINDGASYDTALKDLGFELEKSQLLNTFLNDVYHVSIDDAEVPDLTIGRIKELEETMTETEFKKTEGFESIFNHIDSDELNATTEIMSLPTLAKHSNMRDDEFDTNETYLWVVPGMEGHHERFRTLCRRLKIPAFVLQPGLDYPYEDLQHLSNRYFKVLQKNMYLKKEQNFHLLGYETGVIVALELAALLEKNGLTGTIYCIGDGPDEIKRYIAEQLQMFTSDEELQAGVIQHMFSMLEGDVDVSQLECNLSKCSSWSERIEACTQILLGRMSHSAQYLRALIEVAYARIKMLRQYTATIKHLRSKIVLLKTPSTVTNTSTLHQYSLQPIIVQNLPTPLGQATQDLRCAAIINKYLSKDLLETFENRNLCDTYLLNASTFLQKN